MTDSPGPSPASRARQACEPCRRKKTKCPGEKPVCSFCRRLNQQCTYERTDDPYRIHKPKHDSSHDGNASKDRVEKLEAKVQELFDVLNTLTGSTSGSSRPSIPRANDGIGRTQTSSPLQGEMETGEENLRFDKLLCPDPPKEVFKSLIEIYKTRLDCQPLPLFNPKKLAEDGSRWPSHLRWSFLSLTVPWSKHSFFTNLHEIATSYYTQKARHETFEIIANGRTDLEILQALCLLSLSEIADGNSTSAWMDISIGIRLAITTNIMNNKLGSNVPISSEDKSRCCWSMFALDRMYGSNLSIPPALATEDILPHYPPSTSTPVESGTSRQSNEQFDSSPQLSHIQDLGINAYCMQLLSIWGHTMSYLQAVKENRSEDPWLMQSQYHRVKAKLFDFETRLAQTHRFQRTRFQERELPELEKKRSYWAPWLTMQFLFHAIQGLMNHPFLHIAGRTKHDKFQPPSFLQSTVDQTVLHAGWALKLINCCGEKGFSVYDPFIGHLVSITATIYLFLLNSKDIELATQARIGFERCYDFVAQMSSQWPHLQQTILKLDTLQRGSDTNNSMPSTISVPKAQLSLLWELCDYSASTRISTIPEMASDAVNLNVATQFLSPVNPLGSGSSAPTPGQLNNTDQEYGLVTTQSATDDLWDLASVPYGMSLFDDEQVLSLANPATGRDSWNFGQL